MWLCEADSCYHLSTKPDEKKPGSNPVQLRRLNNKWRHLTVSGDIHISNFTASLSILYNWYKTNLNLNSISRRSSQSTGSSSPGSERHSTSTSTPNITPISTICPYRYLIILAWKKYEYITLYRVRTDKTSTIQPFKS